MGKCIRVSFNNEYDFSREEIQFFMGLNIAQNAIVFRDMYLQCSVFRCAE